MVASITETDIERFIREQKYKLNNERNNLGLSEQGPNQKEPPGILASLGQYENHRKKLQEERHSEYKEFLNSKGNRPAPIQQESAPPKSLSQKELNTQRLEQRLNELKESSTTAREKLNMRRQTPHIPEPLQSPRKAALKENKVVNDFFSKFGEYDRKKQRLKEEREKECKHHLAEENLRRFGIAGGANGYEASLPGLRDNNLVQNERLKVRNEEYNQFLREKEWKDKQRFGSRQKETGLLHQEQPLLAARTPAVADATTGSNHIRWAHPQVETTKRRDELPQHYRWPDSESDYPRRLIQTSGNERTMNPLNIDSDLKDIAKEYSSRLHQPTLNEEIESRLRQTQSPLPAMSSNFLDDPLWAKLRDRTTGFNHQDISPGLPLSQPQPVPSVPNLFMKNALDSLEENRGRKSNNRVPLGNRGYPENQNESDSYATLPLGNERSSAKQRQKHNYRDELQKQMMERNAARIREKELSKRVYEPLMPTGKPRKEPYVAPQQEPPRNYLGQTSNNREPRPTGRQTMSEQLQPDVGSQLGRQIFGSQQGRNPLQGLPTNLIYEPSGLLDEANNNSIDDAYRYYGLKDHFENPTAPDMEPFYSRRAEAEEPNPYQRSNFLSHQNHQKEDPSVGPGAMVFSDLGEVKKTTRNKEQAYMKELEMQIQQKKMQKLKEREAQDRYDRHLEEESKNYNPFGRGGGGAPLKDSSGNVLANLRQVKKGMLNDGELEPAMADIAQTVRSIPEMPPFAMPSENVTAGNPLPSSNPSLQPSHARGGHGIFGQPKTDAQKTAMDKYREELQNQMMDKRNRKLAELQVEKLEEEKINKRLEDDRTKMQVEFEEEEKKKKAKQEEEKRRDDEMKQKVEDQRKAAEKKRIVDDEMRQKDQMEHERQMELEKKRLDSAKRPKSPPVPALQRKIKTDSRQNSAQRQEESKPIPSSRGHGRTEPSTARSQREPEVTHRAQSADVLNQLQVLRKGLQQKYIESELRGHSAVPILENPAVMLGKHQAPINRKAMLIRRGSHYNTDSPSVANPEAMKDFNHLKYRNGSASRSAFRHQFPDPPGDIDALELQQRELIKQQEEALRKIRENGAYKSNYENGHPPLLRQKTVSPFPLLDSRSAFYDAERMPLLTDMFTESGIPKNESARSRRRHRLQSPQLTPLDSVSFHSNSATSLSSLNPDRLAQRNEERLKKLQTMADAISLTEPEEILERFMSKQRYNRSPPSSIY